jgi:hypothetical protein
MPMLSGPEERFQRLVRASLAALETNFAPILGALIRHKYPDEVAAVDFEVFSDEFTSGFPVRAFFLDRSNTEFVTDVGGKATYPIPVNPCLLEIDRVYPLEIEEQLVASSPDSDPWQIATAELFEWFLACWGKAGGSGFRLAATIAHHDSSTELNLINGKTQPRGYAFGA